PYPLSLHDALPIWRGPDARLFQPLLHALQPLAHQLRQIARRRRGAVCCRAQQDGERLRPPLSKLPLKRLLRRAQASATRLVEGSIPAPPPLDLELEIPNGAKRV